MKPLTAIAIVLGLACLASADDFSWKTFKHMGYSFDTPESAMSNHTATMLQDGKLAYLHKGGGIVYDQDGRVSMMMVYVPRSVARSSNELKVKLQRKFKGQNVRVINGVWKWPDGTVVAVNQSRNGQVNMAVLRTPPSEPQQDSDFPLDL